ncbi:hypothetical protein PG994_004987 [Apiospora phragmitis]|uniref:Uncharacterized protein n=1 Tax=Apiospora phragmitis TaxID=2905665 RepID=A0ABR1VW59_9PEZI
MEWPSLQRLEIDVGLVAPSGRWYYTGDKNGVKPGRPWMDDPYPSDDSADDDDEDESESKPDVDPSSEALSEADVDDWGRDAKANGDEPWHQWRTMPDPVEFDPLAIDLVAAVKRMPRLKTCGFRLSPTFDGTYLDTTLAISLECAEAGALLPYKSIKKDMSCKKGNKHLTARRWSIQIGEDTTWEVPEELRAKCTEWVGPYGKIEMRRIGDYGYNTDDDNLDSSSSI